MKYGTVTNEVLESIRSVVGSERTSIGESILDLHSKDESSYQERKPDIGVWPLCAEEISRILKLANEERIPVTPWGAGTSLDGNPIPVEGGIALDLQQMNRVLDLRTEDLQVRVEAGFIYKELNQYLSRYGLCFPPDPGASATIGGMVGNNASGIRICLWPCRQRQPPHGDFGNSQRKGPMAEGSRGRRKNCPFCTGMRRNSNGRAWHWAWEEEVYEERAWGKPRVDEGDQKTFRSQWHHEPWEDL
jgi:hypothetical protein